MQHDMREMIQRFERLFNLCKASCYTEETKISKVTLTETKIVYFYSDEIEKNKGFIIAVLNEIREQENSFFAANKEFHSYQFGGKLGPGYHYLKEPFELADNIVSLGIAVGIIEKITSGNTYKFIDR